MDDPAAFETLARAPLHEMRGAAWDAFLPAVAAWLDHADPTIRARAAERLAMAVFWAEASSVIQARNAGQTLPHDPAGRLAWLLGVINAAQARHPDVIGAFLDSLRFHNLDEPMRGPLLGWLDALRDAPPPGLDPARAEGIAVLVRPFDADDAADVARLVALLDHPSAYLRACAARRLSGQEGRAIDVAAIFALVTQKEIARPGIAGPFWSDWQYAREDLPFDPADWMMDILERRAGPEPDGMPFNGIDFHLHEICDHAPDAVRRMIRGSHGALAIETATEARGVVPGMEPVLRDLAAHPDAAIRQRARFHLAYFYAVTLPPEPGAPLIRHWPDWEADAQAFSFHQGPANQAWCAVIHPREPGARWTDARAWALADRALPPGLRGALVAHPLDFAQPADPAPFRLGDALMRRFAAGASIDMQGDPDAGTWARIEIGAVSLGARWTSFPA
ncbi:hypothetical protein [Roseomonas sp. CECT 9278]|uniref:hypothetical protein n=1 Tax=Roseomonas sp. CECT 9278 TaxID=2845823 RepID=UPI001E4202FE|nr:hypothetical protein [Roseomonas sp. CECT 9278]CAH0269726.1 hypothetical protein ROS9278_03628 [Roseomonas sp. CECT 9278]